MPSTTVVIPEDYPLEDIDQVGQWDALVQVAAGAASSAMARKSQKKDLSAQKKIATRQAMAEEAAAKAAQIQAGQGSGGLKWYHYTFIAVGVIAIGATAIILVKK